MANVQECLDRLADDVDGFIGAALVDFDGGLALGKAGGEPDLDLDVAGAGGLELMRAESRLLRQLGFEDSIDDILITLGEQIHLIRPLERYATVFVWMAIHRDQGVLGLARRQLRNVESDLEI